MPDAPTLVSPANGAWVTQPGDVHLAAGGDGVPAEGYVLYIDETPMITFTTPITTVIVDVSPWTHTWYVKATNSHGDSLPSPTWSLNVFGKTFLPLLRK